MNIYNQFVKTNCETKQTFTKGVIDKEKCTHMLWNIIQP